MGPIAEGLARLLEVRCVAFPGEVGLLKEKNVHRIRFAMADDFFHFNGVVKAPDVHGFYFEGRHRYTVFLPNELATAAAATTPAGM